VRSDAVAEHENAVGASVFGAVLVPLVSSLLTGSTWVHLAVEADGHRINFSLRLIPLVDKLWRSA